MNPTVNRSAPQFAELLNRALSEPGVVSRAYTAFHGYSIGNQILALVQCAERGIPPGPIATFMAYDYERRVSRHPERFGHGAIEGVAAAAGAALMGLMSSLNRS